MNIDPAGGHLGLLAMVNPMVGWIWVATGLMALGSLVALVPSRRGPAAVSTETARAFNPRVLLVGLGVVAPLVAILC